MAINDQGLFGKTVNDAVYMLRNAGDTVTLKISKLNRTRKENTCTLGMYTYICILHE